MSQAPSKSRERLTSPLTWHYAGFAVLLTVTVFLAIRLGLDSAAIDTHAQQVLDAKQVQLKALRIENEPLGGLDQRVGKTREELHDFFQKRIPPSYSTISSHFVDLAVKSGVGLSRVQYSQGPPGPDLTEISMDAGISGEYPQIMHFINSLERDQTFFVIRAMSLTGQQGGMVNLRLRVSTWLRPADAAASGLPPTPQSKNASGAGTPAAGREVE